MLEEQRDREDVTIFRNDESVVAASGSITGREIKQLDRIPEGNRLAREEPGKHQDTPIGDTDVVELNYDIRVTVSLIDRLQETAEFELPSAAPLLEVLQEGAKRLGKTLLPNSEQPLDRLHNIPKHDNVGPPIDDLNQVLGDYLRSKGTSRDFAVELVRAFRVNTRWAVAPKPELSPREILALPAINLDFQQYTLYFPGRSDPLPIDAPIPIERGMSFEAQRDGRYGGGRDVPRGRG